MRHHAERDAARLLGSAMDPVEREDFSQYQAGCHACRSGVRQGSTGTAPGRVDANCRARGAAGPGPGPGDGRGRADDSAVPVTTPLHASLPGTRRRPGGRSSSGPHH